MARRLPPGGPGTDTRSAPGAACKPGSVPAPGCPDAGEGHSSRPTIAGRLEHSHPDTAPWPRPRRSGGPPSTMSLFELAPGGACPAAGHPAVARGLLPHDFTLACAGPSPRGGRTAIGGVVSAALSLGSPRVGVTDLPVLWSPDFPPVNGRCSPATSRPPSAGPRILSRGRPRAMRSRRFASRDRESPAWRDSSSTPIGNHSKYL